MPASQLFTGHAVPPDFSAEPTPKYEPFFMITELTAANYCHICGAEEESDFDPIYRQPRKNPDAKSPGRRPEPSPVSRILERRARWRAARRACRASARGDAAEGPSRRSAPRAPGCGSALGLTGVSESPVGF